MRISIYSVISTDGTTRFLILAICVAYGCTGPCTEAATAGHELINGFKATPDPSISSFQSLLVDSTGNFSFGFLRINRTQLALVILHAASSENFWVANPTSLARWSDRTQLSFNGSLVIADKSTGIFWTTGTEGDRVVLLNDSNLQIQKVGKSPTVVWQSFDFPTNTLVANQNFTSAMTLVSSNGLYSMRLGEDYMGLYAKFNENSNQIYWKHRAMEVKAEIVEGQGPIYALVNSNGYLGMYQTGTAPVDVQPFNSFQQPFNALLILRLEPDGNLKAYYWDGSNWVLDYQAITGACELPSSCGSYGLCTPGSGCSCLDNQTEFRSGECSATAYGDFCGDISKSQFRVVRRKGVELPFKELMGYETTSSHELCEAMCERNCSCWSAVYNNASRFCYLVDYPTQTMVGVGDQSKVGYFKVREGTRKKKMESGFGVRTGLLTGLVALLILAIGLGSYKMWRRRRWMKGVLEEENGLSPGPYKDLGSASFRSIEMSSR